MHVGEEVEHGVVIHKDRLHRDLARRHDKGVPAAALVGQFECLAVLVQHGQTFKGVALVGGCRDDHSVALGCGFGRYGDSAVLYIIYRYRIAGCGEAAASSATAAAGGTAAGGRVCDANDNLLFHDHIGVCVDRSTDQGHRAILITKAECISADNSVRIILFQRPSYRSRIGLQLFRSKGLAELIERRYLNCRQIQRSVFPNGRRNSVCGNRSQPSRGIDRQRNVVTLDVAETGIDLGRIFFQCLECSVFE